MPIFYASKLANKSLRVYQTFVNMMNAHVRALSDVFSNPFHLQHVKSMQQVSLRHAAIDSGGSKNIHPCSWYRVISKCLGRR